MAVSARLRRLAWVGLFSAGEGLPFGIFKDLVPVWLRAAGVSLPAIGGLSALAAPWSLKVLWSPLVDRLGTRRAWILGCLVGAAGALGLAALAGLASPWTLAALLGAFTVLAATSDVAVDAWTIGIVPEGEEGPANAVRVAFYRVAMLLAGGLGVALAGAAGWRPVLVGLALVLAAIGLASLLAPPLPFEAAGGERPSLLAGVAHWMARPGAVPLALLVLLYKWPDAALGPMVRTFWVDSGLGLGEIGLVASPLGLAATIAGAGLGGWLVARLGILRGLFWLGLAQAVSNLAYAGAALAGGGRAVVLAAAGVESLCGGLGTAAFLSLLMRVCEKERAAVEYALLTALFASTRDLTGAISGIGVARLGYAGWFAATTLLAIPGLALVFHPALVERVGER